MDLAVRRLDDLDLLLRARLAALAGLARDGHLARRRHARIAHLVPSNLAVLADKDLLCVAGRAGPVRPQPGLGLIAARLDGQPGEEGGRGSPKDWPYLILFPP